MFYLHTNIKKKINLMAPNQKWSQVIWKKTMNSFLRVVYTMDHEVVRKPCKICDWLLNSSRDHFGLHQGRFFFVVKVTMEFEVPKGHVLRVVLSTNMVQWVLLWERQKRCSSSGKRQGPMAKKWCYNRFIMQCILGKRRRRQEKTREWSKLNSSFKPALSDIYWRK